MSGLKIRRETSPRLLEWKKEKKLQKLNSDKFFKKTQQLIGRRAVLWHKILPEILSSKIHADYFFVFLSHELIKKKKGTSSEYDEDASNNFGSFLTHQLLIASSEHVVEENERLITYLSLSVTVTS